MDGNTTNASGEAGGARRRNKKRSAKEPRRKRGRKGKRDRKRQAGREATAARPAFATHFPADPMLDGLLEAFEAGHYAHVRNEASKLAADSDDELVREAALELRRRIEPDRGAIALWLLGVMLMVALYAFYWVKQHG